MPALVAVQPCRRMKSSLQRRYKAKFQMLIAVVRKLLHAIYGNLAPYDGLKLFPALIQRKENIPGSVIQSVQAAGSVLLL
jgi:hypothetical protein